MITSKALNFGKGQATAVAHWTMNDTQAVYELLKINSKNLLALNMTHAGQNLFNDYKNAT